MFHEMGAEKSLQYRPHSSDTSSSTTRLVPKGHAGQWSLGKFFPDSKARKIPPLGKAKEAYKDE